jgi:hypothetical protein
MEQSVTSVPQNKQELHQAIAQAFDKILSDYSTIPEIYSRKIGVEGNVRGTEITVCDTLAYLIGWGHLVLKWYEQKSGGHEMQLPEVGYKWNELGKLAEAFYSQYFEWSYSDLIAEFRATTTQILSLVESLSNEKLYHENWYKEYTLGRMIQFNTSSPMKNMRSKIRKFKKLNEIKC